MGRSGRWYPRRSGPGTRGGAGGADGPGSTTSRSGSSSSTPGTSGAIGPSPSRRWQHSSALAQAIMARWRMPAWQVVAHSDIAPDRKEDPGELFDWARLAREGIGMWPAPGWRADGAGEARAALAAIGYPLEGQGVSLAAVARGLPAPVPARLLDGVPTRRRCSGWTMSSPCFAASLRLRDYPVTGGRTAAPAATRGRKVRAPREHGAG